jgi:hypothetical protein
VKAAKLPPCEQECLACGRKFQSRKTAKKHKCSKDSKVVCKKEVAATGSGLRPIPTAQLNKPAAPITPPVPTAPTHNRVVPPVTGVLGAPTFDLNPFIALTKSQIAAYSSTNIRRLLAQMMAGTTVTGYTMADVQALWDSLEEALAVLEKGGGDDQEGRRP